MLLLAIDLFYLAEVGEGLESRVKQNLSLQISYFNQKVFCDTLQRSSSDVRYLVLTWDGMTGDPAAQGAAMDYPVLRNILSKWEAHCRGVDGKGIRAI